MEELWTLALVSVCVLKASADLYAQVGRDPNLLSAHKNYDQATKFEDLLVSRFMYIHLGKK